MSEGLEFEVAHITPVFAQDRTTVIGQVRPSMQYQAAGTDGEWLTLASPNGGVGYVRQSDVYVMTTPPPAASPAPRSESITSAPVEPPAAMGATPTPPPAPQPTTTPAPTTAGSGGPGPGAPQHPTGSQARRLPEVIAWLIAIIAVGLLVYQYRTDTNIVNQDEPVLFIALVALVFLGFRLLSKGSDRTG